MNKYKVKISHVFYEILDIEAENEELARKEAVIELEKESHKIRPQYETTLPPEHWAIITEEQFNQMVKDFESKMNQEEPSNIIIP